MKLVIVGAGVAGISAAEALRRRDAGCRITLIGDERFYFRAALAKYFQHLIEPQEVVGRPDEWYAAREISFVQGRAVDLDVERKVVTCADGTAVPYDRLLLATGAEPFVPDWPGRELQGVGAYRGRGDVERFLRLIEGGARRAVVIGGGILGIEIVEDLAKLGLEVTLFVRGTSILDMLFDAPAAEIILKQLLDAGVRVRIGTEAARFEGDSGRLAAVVTKEGERVPCEIAGVAVGIRANLDYLRGSPIAVDRAIVVDGTLAASVPDVWAAGDCCAVKASASASAVPTRTWLTSARQGRTAARNMLGRAVPFDEGVLFNVSHAFNAFYAVMGVFNPRDPSAYGFRSWRFPDGGYMRWTLAGTRVVGAIIVDVQRAIWPTRQLIESAVDVSPALEGDISKIDLLALVPQEKQTLF